MAWESEPVAHLATREPEYVWAISECYSGTNNGDALRGGRLGHTPIQAIWVGCRVVIQEECPIDVVC
jgi:hypothetical protein